MCNKYNSSEHRSAFDGGEARGSFTRTEKFSECGGRGIEEWVKSQEYG